MKLNFKLSLSILLLFFVLISSCKDKDKDAATPTTGTLQVNFGVRFGQYFRDSKLNIVDNKVDFDSKIYQYSYDILDDTKPITISKVKAQKHCYRYNYRDGFGEKDSTIATFEITGGKTTTITINK